MADKLPADMLGDRSDRLKEMRDLLADLPRRLAGVLGEQRQRDANKIAAFTDERKGRGDGGGERGGFREALAKAGGEAPWGELPRALISGVQELIAALTSRKKETEADTGAPLTGKQIGKLTDSFPEIKKVEREKDAALAKLPSNAEIEEFRTRSSKSKPMPVTPIGAMTALPSIWAGSRPEAIPEAEVLPDTPKTVPPEYIVAPPKPPPAESMPLPSLFAGPRPGMAPSLPPAPSPFAHLPTALETLRETRRHERAMLAPVPGAPPFKPTMPPLAEDHPDAVPTRREPTPLPPGKLAMPSVSGLLGESRKRWHEGPKGKTAPEPLKAWKWQNPTVLAPGLGAASKPHLRSPDMPGLPGAASTPVMQQAGGGPAGGGDDFDDLIAILKESLEETKKIGTALSRQDKTGAGESGKWQAAVNVARDKPKESIAAAGAAQVTRKTMMDRVIEERNMGTT